MIIYLSHAVGTLEDFDAMKRRHDNLGNAIAWLHYLTHTTMGHVITMPWFPNVVALGEMLRDRALADQTAIMRRCDAIVFVGSAPTGHQLVERSDARRFRLADIDLTDRDWSPPRVDTHEDYEMRALIANRIDAAVARNRIRL